jgi:DNA-binding GntR family transcriptional regulator
MQDKENTDISDLIKSDLDFHFHIISRSENERIINIWRGLSGQILVLLYKFIINKGLGSNLDYEHSEIIEAFKRNDTSDIQKILTRHINDIKYFLQDNYY